MPSGRLGNPARVARGSTSRVYEETSMIPSLSLEERVRTSPRLKALALRTEPLWRTLLYATIVPPKNALALMRLWLRGCADLHFGCGKVSDARFVNIDALPFGHVDFVTRSPMLRGFRRGSAASLYACHVFEHFPHAQQSRILARWHALLRPGGRLRLSVPVFDKLVRTYQRASGDVKAIQMDLMGAQTYPGNVHFAIFNREHLTALLTRAGFVSIRNWHPSDEPDWPRDYSWVDEVSLNLEAETPTA